MGCNNSKQSFFKIDDKRERLRLLSDSLLNHGEKLYLNENELFLSINSPIIVFDTQAHSTVPPLTQTIDYVDDQKISYEFKNLHVIFLNYILKKLLFNTTAYENVFKNHVDMPFKYGLFNYEELLLITVDEKKLHAYFLKQFNSINSMTIFYLHGNTGNIGFALSHAKKLYLKLKCNILLVDYRSYGFSMLDKENLSENTCYLDAKAGLEFLTSRSDIDLKRICVIG